MKLTFFSRILRCFGWTCLRKGQNTIHGAPIFSFPKLLAEVPTSVRTLFLSNTDRLPGLEHTSCNEGRTD